MGGRTEYRPIDPETLGARLKNVEAVVSQVGADWANWEVKEVGDGNLNLVFIVKGSDGTIIVKQALPYVRLVGDSWPLPLSRSFFEYQALTRQQARDPGSVPRIFHFDEIQALIAMEYLSPHTILRNKLIAGEKVAGLAKRLGQFCARTAFRGSDLSMKTSERKADAALFLGNVEIMAITEGLVFCDPYFEAELNNHTEGLDPVVRTLRDDVEMKTEIQHLFAKFASNAETMLHGDLHTGSIMCTGDEMKIIDPEFGMYGPAGFDTGMLIANFLMAYFSQPAHRSEGELEGYQEWILGIIDDFWSAFGDEFKHLWETERTGMLYPKSMFEDQGHSSQPALEQYLASLWEDAMGFCGIEMHRRVLSLAHNADFESIEDTSVRAPLEARNLMMGRSLIKHRAGIADSKALLELARRYNGESVL